MARILIVYGTTEGQTRKIAERLGNVAAAQGHAVQVVDSTALSGPLPGSEPDAILVGASVHQGRYQSAVEHLVRTNVALLNSTPSAFFSVSLVAASPDPEHRKEAEKLIQRFLADTGWRPTRVASMAGALRYSEYDFFKRFVMRLIAWREGGATDTSHDHEYTDWDAVETFAQTFLCDLADPTGSAPARKMRR